MTLLRARSKGQPVPDLTAASTPAEHRFDRELALADRLDDMADRDLCAAVEDHLRRTQSQPRERRLPPPASGAGCAPGVIHNEERAA